MYKLIAFLGVVLCSTSVYGQQSDKFALLGKAGYAFSAYTDAFYGGVSFEYLFWKRLGIVAGYSQITGSTFPNKSGSVDTGEWYKEDPYGFDYSYKGDLYEYIHNKMFDERHSVNYDSYSAMSVGLGIMFHVLSNKNNIIALSAGGNYSWQVAELYYTRKWEGDKALMKTNYDRFAGFGFLGDITYRRRVYRSFWVGAYLQAALFAGDFSNNNNSIGVELSVRF